MLFSASSKFIWQFFPKFLKFIWLFSPKFSKFNKLFPKTSKRSVGCQFLIENRVSYNGKQKYMGTGISVYPRHWEEKTQRVRVDAAVAVHIGRVWS
jgi:hypothetical protein